MNGWRHTECTRHKGGLDITTLSVIKHGRSDRRWDVLVAGALPWFRTRTPPGAHHQVVLGCAAHTKRGKKRQTEHFRVNFLHKYNLSLSNFEGENGAILKSVPLKQFPTLTFPILSSMQNQQYNRTSQSSPQAHRIVLHSPSPRHPQPPLTT